MLRHMPSISIRRRVNGKPQLIEPHIGEGRSTQIALIHIRRKNLRLMNLSIISVLSVPEIQCMIIFLTVVCLGLILYVLLRDELSGLKRTFRRHSKSKEKPWWF